MFYACILIQWKKSESVSRSVISDSVTPYTVAHQAPLWIEFPSKNTEVGHHSLFQGTFPPRDQAQVSCIGR